MFYPIEIKLYPENMIAPHDGLITPLKSYKLKPNMSESIDELNLSINSETVHKFWVQVITDHK
jgi:hypothetical protein